MWSWFREDLPPLIQIALVASILSGIYSLAELALTQTCK
jgi:hypothetical protein